MIYWINSFVSDQYLVVKTRDVSAALDISWLCQAKISDIKYGVCRRSVVTSVFTSLHVVAPRAHLGGYMRAPTLQLTMFG